MLFLTAPSSTQKKWQQGTDRSQIRIMLEIENALFRDWNKVFSIRITYNAHFEGYTKQRGGSLF
jgi:hypothetical protein